MSTILGLVGSLGFFVAVIILIINAIRRKPKKKIGIICGIFFAILVIGIATTPTPPDKLEAAKVSGTISDDASKNSDEDAKKDDDSQTPKETKSSETMGQKNARAKAKTYLAITAFSYSGLIKQLEFEGFSTEESTYAADNCGADWNEQAGKKAENYLSINSFSRSGLIEQLEYEGFSSDQAEYGAKAVGY
ncbi:Ltp family lipoprotein [Anaerotignum sp.]|uniref:Ltp family lipoprotein n=1 Tax=Anaerotignum sp. TaxID=2039241 RepID=UPI0028A22E8B|nr:Ltp family lipoprotein [Anaerotignum sp.]